MGNVKFNAERHIYTVDGTERVSVTQALSMVGVIDKTWYTDHGRNRGTAVHDALMYDDENDLDEVGLDKEVLPRLRAWRKFKVESGIKILQSEIPVAHPDLPYAGTPDRVVEWKGIKGIIDIKSGGKESWHALQTMGYALCFDEPMDRYSVYLKGNGRYTLEKHIDRRDRAVFLAIISVATWMKANMKGVKK